MKVKAKKYLGQHFLKEKHIAKKIVNSLKALNAENILEIGPGTGVLTSFLLQKNSKLYLIEIDNESIEYLNSNFSNLNNKIINEDFLKFDFKSKFKNQTAVIGNFPYYISSQIIFKVLENKELIPEVVGMFQKEVAKRICATPGNKTYGIISIFVQAFYNAEYLFTVSNNAFSPPPKIESGVIRLVRKNDINLGCDENLFSKVVKTSFNQRRKMLRNSLKSIIGEKKISADITTKRPEQLSVKDFVSLTKILYD